MLRSKFSYHQKTVFCGFRLHHQVCFHSVNTTSNDLLYADVKNITLGVFIVFINFKNGAKKVTLLTSSVQSLQFSSIKDEV